MAIPKFYSLIQRKWPQLVKKLNKPISCDYVCVDVGSIIHNCFQFASNEDDIINNSIEFINKLISVSNPSKKVYVAFDGVPPISKVKEQAHRRKTNKLNSSGSMDRNILSPGTEFSERLYKGIEKGMLDSKVTVVISSSNEAGEGEQKIIQYISSLEPSNIIIYGLDADLIILSLTLKSEITILREIYRKSPRSIPQKDFEYLSVDVFKSLLAKEYGINTEKKINDSIMTFCLLGNDFLLKPFGFNLDHDSINNIFLSLKEVHSQNLYITTETFDFDHNGFKIFCDELYNDGFEEYNVLYKMKKSEEAMHALTLNLSSLSLKEKKSQIRDHINKHMKEKYEEWKLANYPGLKKLNTDDIIELAKDYLIGLLWCFKYYMKSQSDKYWIYGHEYAPMLSDLVKGLDESVNNSYKSLPKAIILKPVEHLCLITPESSRDLLPEKYRTKFRPADLTGDYSQLQKLKTQFDSL